MKTVLLAFLMVICAGFAALAHAGDRMTVEITSFDSAIVLTTGLENAASSLAAIGQCCSKTGSPDDSYSMSCHSDSKQFVSTYLLTHIAEAPVFAEGDQPHPVFVTANAFFRPPIT